MSGNTPAYVGWTGEGGSVVQISQRRLVSHTMPAFEATVVPVATPAWATLDFPAAASSKNLLFSFNVPASLVNATSFNCVYASSNVAPSTRNTPNSVIPRHDQVGQFKLNSAPLTATNTTSSQAGASGNQSSAKYCIDPAGTSCVVIVRDAVAKLASVTVYSSLKGWAAIGTGSAMAGSTMFVGWKNDGKTVISQRNSAGNALPSTVASGTSTFTAIDTPSSIQIPNTTNTAFSFQVPESVLFLTTTTGSNNFIFAGSDSTPSDKTNPSSDFPIHSLKAAFSLDVSQLGAMSTGVSVEANPSRATLVFLHGILMFAGFAVVMPFAIFIARYMKSRWVKSWFLIHVLLMTLGSGGLMIAGLVCVEWTLGLDGNIFARNGVHGILGAAIIFGFYPVQVVLGVVCNALYNEKRTSVPWWDRLHHWLGRLIGLAAIVNMYLGINLWTNSSLGYVIGYWVWIALVVIVLFGFVGELLMVRRHRGVQFNEDGSTVGIGRQTATLPVPSVVGTSGHWFHETRMALSNSSGSSGSSIGGGSGYVTSSKHRLHNLVNEQQEVDKNRGHFTDDGVFKLPAKKAHKYQI
ncbi:hypothetical protein HDU81_005595 [Chytriomyces hyalinus]|nr:hypothetical protein HDU81_005595 [Chytriomyces hyalinus]